MTKLQKYLAQQIDTQEMLKGTNEFDLKLNDRYKFICDVVIDVCITEYDRGDYWTPEYVATENIVDECMGVISTPYRDYEIDLTKLLQ